MNFLQLVQRTIRESGSQTTVPDSLSDVEGLSALFKDWVATSWEEIQNERSDWFFRTKESEPLIIDPIVIEKGHEISSDEIDVDLTQLWKDIQLRDVYLQRSLLQTTISVEHWYRGLDGLGIGYVPSIYRLNGENYPDMTLDRLGSFEIASMTVIVPPTNPAWSTTVGTVTGKAEWVAEVTPANPDKYFILSIDEPDLPPPLVKEITTSAFVNSGDPDLGAVAPTLPIYIYHRPAGDAVFMLARVFVLDYTEGPDSLTLAINKFYGQYSELPPTFDTSPDTYWISDVPGITDMSDFLGTPGLLNGDYTVTNQGDFEEYKDEISKPSLDLFKVTGTVDVLSEDFVPAVDDMPTKVSYVSWTSWPEMFGRSSSRLVFNRDNTKPNRPRWFTINPEGNVWVYPAPDEYYHMTFFGPKRVQKLVEDTDEPIMHDDMHMGIVWRALMEYGLYHDDRSVFERARSKWRGYKKLMDDRLSPDITLSVDILYRG